MERKVSEQLVIFLVGAVQVINIMDFVMVMPMGPYFAEALKISKSELGHVAGSYTLAAAVSGLAGSFFLDRFDRRKALLWSMLGLVAGTAAGGLATGMTSLQAARVIAGLFGGPATSVSLSIIADVVPQERRGKALGAVMGAFSVASVVGIPAALFVCQWQGWRTPFIALALLGAAVSIGAVLYLPPMTGHLAAARAQAGHRLQAVLGLFTRPLILNSYAMTATAMMSGFILIPNIPAFVLGNLHYPRERYGLLYFAGGIVSFFAMRWVGQLVDRFGSFSVGTVGVGMQIVVLYVGFVHSPQLLPVVMIFMAFMLANSFRNVAYSTLANKVPGPTERAQFMSIQSSVQHLASSLGAIVSSWMLSEGAGGLLVGIDNVAYVSIGLTLTLPIFLYSVEGQVRRRAAAAAPTSALHPIH